MSQVNEQTRRRGRPKAESTRDRTIKIRVDENDLRKIDVVCQHMAKSRSEIIRIGIDRLFAEIEN